MAQPATLTTVQLDVYLNRINTGGVTEAVKVYQELYDQGYNYAGWAKGVATGDSITGTAALDYLTGTAWLGLGGQECKNLSETQVDAIRLGMAKGYVESLQQIVINGSVSSDVNFDQTQAFHQRVFEQNGLTLSNWTLQIPMELIRQTEGDAAAEAMWVYIRDTGGDGLDALWSSQMLYTKVGSLAFNPDPAIAQQALDWIDQVPGIINFDAIGRTWETIKTWLANTSFPDYNGFLGSLGLGQLIAPTVNTNFLDARNVVIQVDPLVLDLDGDGLELTGASGAILFDHNADNIKTGTGWAGRDDGFLVRDLNGNGTIDTGRELFGVDTIKSNNTLATQGFDALRDLDSNADGQITSADAAYGQLKVWQDTNQDGISQSTELKTLAEHGITRIGLNGTSTGPQAGQTINNNQVALSTTFTQNGQTKTVGAIDLEANNFFTEFPTEVVDETGNPVAITEQALSLPQMNGAGMVRNMRAAASLDAAQTTQVGYHSIVSFHRAENLQWHRRPYKVATRYSHLEVRL